MFMEWFGGRLRYAALRSRIASSFVCVASLILIFLASQAASTGKTPDPTWRARNITPVRIGEQRIPEKETVRPLPVQLSPVGRHDPLILQGQPTFHPQTVKVEPRPLIADGQPGGPASTRLVPSTHPFILPSERPTAQQIADMEARRPRDLDDLCASHVPLELSVLQDRVNRDPEVADLLDLARERGGGDALSAMEFTYDDGNVVSLAPLTDQSPALYLVSFGPDFEGKAILCAIDSDGIECFDREGSLVLRFDSSVPEVSMTYAPGREECTWATCMGGCIDHFLYEDYWFGLLCGGVCDVCTNFWEPIDCTACAMCGIGVVAGCALSCHDNVCMYCDCPDPTIAYGNVYHLSAVPWAGVDVRLADCDGTPFGAIMSTTEAGFFAINAAGASETRVTFDRHCDPVLITQDCYPLVEGPNDIGSFYLPSCANVAEVLGTTLHSDASPWADVGVYVTDCEWEEIYDYGVSDGNGDIYLEFPPGHVDFLFQCPECPGILFHTGCMYVSEEGHAFDFYIDDCPTDAILAGRVIHEVDGTPWPGVTLYATDCEYYVLDQDTTDGQGAYDLSFEAQGFRLVVDPNCPGGELYETETCMPITPGNYAVSDIELPECGAVLSNYDGWPDGVDPDSGFPGDIFTFRVHYYDPEGHGPAVQQVRIDDQPYTMSGSGDDADYSFTCSGVDLGVGMHDYYFYFEDSDHEGCRLPVSGEWQVTVFVPGDYVVRPDGNGDYVTIQDAIDAAVDGVVITLTGGTFVGDGNRDIDFLGKAITVRSQSDNPETCIIDCQGNEEEPHRAFNFRTGEGPDSVLRGITMRNAYGPYGPYPPDEAGAILCDNGGSPTITNCVFENNTGQKGGAMLLLDWGNPTVSSCEFRQNTSPAGNATSTIYAWYSNAHFLDCHFVNNVGGLAIYVMHEPITLERCVFEDHSDVQGVIGTQESYEPVIITDCVFRNNDGWPAAVDCGGLGLMTISGCTFYGNLCAVAVGDNSEANVDHSVLSFSTSFPAIWCEPLASVTLTCCDVYGNAGGDYVGCIEDQYGINGNICEDPLFCDPDNGDYQLFDTSPCAPENNPECGLIGALGVGCVEQHFLVKPDGTGDYPTIQAAIDAASHGAAIELADGSFIGPGNRNIDFQGKAITVRSQSGDPEACIIDCLWAERGFKFESGEDANSVLEGVTIRNGSADTGGGLFCNGTSPTIRNCIIADCSADSEGGGLYCNAAWPTLINCLFHGNEGDTLGGAVCCYQSMPILVNCTFSDNWAGMYGGGLFVGNSSPILTNCILWGDDPEEIFLYSGSPAVTYCNVEGGWEGEGNIDALPRFADAESDDYRIIGNSPCIDAADNTAVPDEITTDLAGNPRFHDDPGVNDTGHGDPPIVDMGAYEFQGESDPCPADFDGDGDVDTADLLFLLGAWGTPGGDVDGDGDTDTADLLALLGAWGACP